MSYSLRVVLSSWYAVAICLVISIGLVAYSPPFAALNGYLFPVVDRLTITKITETTLNGQPAIMIEGYAMKLRSCSPTDLDVSVERRGIFGWADYEIQDEAQARQKGMQEWEKIIVGITKERVDELHIVGYHSCMGFPVRTRFL